MKLAKYFEDFMKTKVNLNLTRINTLREKVDTITSFIEGDDLFCDMLIDVEPQGSWAQKTIIKPATDSDEFDADVLVYISENEDWDAQDYINELYKIFNSSGDYKALASRKTRCVRIKYAGDFHVDLVPTIRRTDFIGNDRVYITNRDENIFEETNPEGYLEWFNQQNATVGNNYLIKVIRLAKYLRDIKNRFSVSSILISTLLAGQVNNIIGYVDTEEDYEDIPTSMKTLFNRLDHFLQSHYTMPEIKNPSLPTEDLTRCWDQEKYSNFRDRFHQYTIKINEAFDDSDELSSIEKWKAIFGDDFYPKSITLSAIESSFSRMNLKHQEMPKWPPVLSDTVWIAADKYINGRWQRFSSGDVHQKGYKLRFISNTGVPRSYDVYWQVVNTGEEATVNNDLRGEINRGSEIQNESTKYTGTHWIECFIVKDGSLMARSDKFIVNIE
jgi:hypothetical protein